MKTSVFFRGSFDFWSLPGLCLGSKGMPIVVRIAVLRIAIRKYNIGLLFYRKMRTTGPPDPPSTPKTQKLMIFDV